MLFQKFLCAVEFSEGVRIVEKERKYAVFVSPVSTHRRFRE
jgi:hypothetical protein